MGGTPKSATAVAALAADANHESALALDDDDILGGQGLVEAVFSGMFEEEFDGVMPIRNHKVLLLSCSDHPKKDLPNALDCDMLLAEFSKQVIMQRFSRQVVRGGLRLLAGRGLPPGQVGRCLPQSGDGRGQAGAGQGRQAAHPPRRLLWLQRYGRMKGPFEPKAYLHCRAWVWW